MNTKSSYDDAAHSASRAAPIVVGVLLLVFLVANSFVIVKAGHVGVIVTLGAVQDVALEEGFHLKKPVLDKVEQMDVRLTRSHAKAMAASKDLQTVSTEVTIQYSLVGEMAPRTFQRIGQRTIVSQTLIEPAIQESVKAVTAKYTAESLVTQRSEVKLQIQQAITTFLDVTLEQKEAQGAVNLANVAITDFDFSDEFNKAIELKVRAEQEALQAKNEKIMRVTQAEAAAQEIQLAAEAAAYQIEVESKQRAAAITREAEALKGNEELISLRAVEAWNGAVPRYMGGQSAIPFFNITDEISGE